MKTKVMSIAAGALVAVTAAMAGIALPSSGASASERPAATPAPTMHFVSFDFSARGLPAGKVLTVEYVQGVNFEPGGILARFENEGVVEEARRHQCARGGVDALLQQRLRSQSGPGR